MGTWFRNLESLVAVGTWFRIAVGTWFRIAVGIAVGTWFRNLENRRGDVVQKLRESGRWGGGLRSRFAVNLGLGLAEEKLRS